MSSSASNTKARRKTRNQYSGKGYMDDTAFKRAARKGHREFFLRRGIDPDTVPPAFGWLVGGRRGAV